MKRSLKQAFAAALATTVWITSVPVLASDLPVKPMEIPKSITLTDTFGLHAAQYEVHLLQERLKTLDPESSEYEQINDQIAKAASEVSDEGALSLYPVDDHSWEGISYEASTNTITLNNFSRFNSWVELSGSDPVTINLVGENKLGTILTNGAPIVFEGEGSLEVNPSVTGEYPDGYEMVSYTNEYMWETALSAENAKENMVRVDQDATVVFNSCSKKNEEAITKFPSIRFVSTETMDPDDMITYSGKISGDITWESDKYDGPYQDEVAADYDHVYMTFPVEENVYTRNVPKGQEDEDYYIASAYRSDDDVYYAAIYQDDDGFWYESDNGYYASEADFTLYNPAIEQAVEPEVITISGNDIGQSVSGNEVSVSGNEVFDDPEPEFIDPAKILGDENGMISVYLHTPFDGSATVYTKEDSDNEYLMIKAKDARNDYIEGIVSPLIDEQADDDDDYIALLTHYGDFSVISDFIKVEGSMEDMGYTPKTQTIDAPFTYVLTAVNTSVKFFPEEKQDEPNVDPGTISGNTVSGNETDPTDDPTDPSGSVSGNTTDPTDPAADPTISGNDVDPGQTTEPTDPGKTDEPSSISNNDVEPGSDKPKVDPDEPQDGPAIEDPAAWEPSDSTKPVTGNDTASMPSAGAVIPSETPTAKVSTPADTVKEASKPTGKTTADYIPATSKKTVTVPSSVTINGKKYKTTAIGKSAFKKSKVQKVTVAKTILCIKDSAFESCSSLKKVTFKKNSRLRKIQKNAFKKCTNLEKITLPDTVIEIQKGAFAGDNKLKSVTLNGNHIKNIRKGAFKNCKGIKFVIKAKDKKTFDRTVQMIKNSGLKNFTATFKKSKK